MIFVTVGTQLPFDRLVHTVDQWAGTQGREDVFAQTGDTTHPPRFIEHVPHLEPATFQSYFDEASVIVSHAGIGTILSALELGKPLLIVPRRAELGEHRNDHQLATAERFSNVARNVIVAYHESDIERELERIEGLAEMNPLDHQPSPELLRTLEAFIAGGAPEARGRAECAHDNQSLEASDPPPEPAGHGHGGRAS